MEATIIDHPKGRKQALNACTEPCSIERGMRVLGGKWTGSILWHLKDDPVRFNDLARMIAGASRKMLTERLRQLEDQGLVAREVLDTRPIAVAYSLTPLGVSALTCLEALKDWSESVLKAPVTEKHANDL